MNSLKGIQTKKKEQMLLSNLTIYRKVFQIHLQINKQQKP